MLSASIIINLIIDSTLNVNQIAYKLNMIKSSISHQLKKLKDNGVVKNHKEGKEVYYSLDD